MAIRARTAGWRLVTLVTKLPTLTRDVAAAVAASVVQHSSRGSVSRPRLTKWSQAQAVENPAASTRAADSSHQRPDTPMVVRLTPTGMARPERARRGAHRGDAMPASSATRIMVSVARSRSSRLM